MIRTKAQYKDNGRTVIVDVFRGRKVVHSISATHTTSSYASMFTSGLQRTARALGRL